MNNMLENVFVDLGLGDSDDMIMFVGLIGCVFCKYSYDFYGRLSDGEVVYYDIF